MFSNSISAGSSQTMLQRGRRRLLSSTCQEILAEFSPRPSTETDPVLS